MRDVVWHLAPSLATLRDEVNRRWPNRDRTSDGTIGDAAHQATRSDHNPNSRGSVNAVDIDKDGVSVAAIIAAAERHPSVHYWIFNRQIADRDTGFARRRYTGSNPHDKHLHISIRQTTTAENDRRPWGLLEEDPMANLDDNAKADVREASMLGVYDALKRAANPDDPTGRQLAGFFRTILQPVRDDIAGVDEATVAAFGEMAIDDLADVLRRGMTPDRLASLAAKLSQG